MKSLCRVCKFAVQQQARRYTFQPAIRRIAVRSFTTAEYQDEMGKDKDKVSYQLKVPKGTKDWEGKDMVIRDKIFGTITEVFKRHGAVTIDTYVFISLDAAISRH